VTDFLLRRIIFAAKGIPEGQVSKTATENVEGETSASRRACAAELRSCANILHKEKEPVVKRTIAPLTVSLSSLRRIPNAFAGRLLRAVMLGVLVTQLALPPHAHGNDPDRSAGGSVPASLLAAGELAGAPDFVKNYFASLKRAAEADAKAPVGRALFNGRQRVDVFETVGDETRLKDSYPIQGLDLTRDRIDFLPREISVAYDAAKGELAFERWVYDSRLQRKVKTHAHVIEQIRLTGTVADSVVRENNVTLVSTLDWGTLGGFSPVVLSSLFNSFVPLSTWWPPASVIAPEANVAKIELLTPATEPTLLRDVDGNPVDKFAGHDVVFTLRFGDRTERIHFSYRHDVLARLRNHVFAVLLLLQAANPREDLMDKLAALLARERERRVTVASEEAKLAELAINDKDTLPLRILRTTARTMDFGKLAELLSPNDSGATAFDRLATADTFEWTSKNWAELHRVVQQSKRLEEETASRLGVPVERLHRSWGEVLAAQIAHPEKPVAEVVEAIAAKKAHVSDSFMNDVKELAKAQFTAKRLLALGAAVAGDLGNLATGGKVTAGLFSVLSTLFGWTTQTWGLNVLVHETVKYSHNFYEPFAFTSTAALLGGLLLLQPLCYVVAKTIALARDERNEDGTRWSAAQAFFSYGGRMYATLTYPVQLLLFRLAGQQNVSHALANGGGLRTPGALHIPFSARSAARGRERMTQYFETDGIRKERAMLIAALAVSQYFKDKMAPMDPATILMVMAAHQEGKLEDLKQLIENAPPDVAWSQLAQRVYAMLVKMDDTGVGTVDETSIHAYAQVMTRAVSKFGKIVSPKTGIVGCVENACSWMRDRAAAFGTWASSIAATLLTGGTMFRFYEKNKRFVATERDVRVADEQFRKDYAGSEALTAATDSQRFPVAFQINRHLDKVLAAMADAAEQCAIYGAQGGVEQSMVNPLAANLHNPSPPISDLGLRRNHLPYVPGGENADDYELGTGRRATVLQSLFTLGAALGDPKAGFARLFFTQKRRMDATLQALQGKGLFGYVPRVVALLLISLVAAAQSDGGIGTWDASAVGHTAWEALLRQANVIFNKLSLVYGAAGFALGYAVIWAPVIWSQNTLEDAAASNRRKVAHVDHLLEQGMRNDEEVVWKSGVRGMLALYAEAGTSLPEQFHRAPDDYSLSLAKELVEYSKKHPPLATVISGKMSWLNNIAVGTTISTVLALGLSHSMYDPDVAIVPQLLTSLGAFTATYLGVSSLVKVTPPVVRAVRDFVSRCARLVVGDSSATSGPTATR
jgi:hypothetical protein